MHSHQKFDVLRGGASLIVLLAHVFQIYWLRFFGPEHPYRYLSSTVARHAVLIFFLMSGYLITLSIIRNQAKQGRFDASDYAASRAARIWPPVAGSMVVLLACYAVITMFDLPGASVPYGTTGDLYVARELFSINYTEVASALLLIDGLGTTNAPLWSLYFEAWLYVIAGIAAVGCYSTTTGRRAIFSGISIALFVAFAAYKVTFAFYAAVWLVGAAACLAIHHQRANASRHAACIAIAGCTGLLMILAIKPSALLLGSKESAAGFLAQGLFALVYAYLAFFWRRLDRLSGKTLTRAADFSYSLYIVHFPLLLLGLSLSQDWMGNSFARTAVASVLCAVTTVAISWKFAQLFERPVYFRGVIRRGSHLKGEASPLG